MNGKKNSAIAFGITLVSANRTGNSNTNPEKRRSAFHRKNTIPGKTAQVSIHEFDSLRSKMPLTNKPFTPDMFSCEPKPLPVFPRPKMSKEMERIHKELERSRSSRTASYPSSKKSSSTAGAFAWEFFKVVFSGVFLAFKYAFIAVAVIITIGCMICAGRPTGGLK